MIINLHRTNGQVYSKKPLEVDKIGNMGEHFLSLTSLLLSMLSGALIRTPENFEIETLNGVSWERENNDLTLRSVIQFQEHRIIVDVDTTAEAALAIHEDIVMEPVLVEEDGTYRIIHRDAVKTKWAHIYVVRGYVVVDRLGNRGFVREIINRGLNLTTRAHNVFLDTTRMVRDNANHWVRGFSDRIGRVDRGTVFGEAVEQDSVFGPELERSAKRSVGWVTSFFGSPAKVRVSPQGSVTVWANPPEELFLRFLRMEILPYVIALP